MRLFNIVKDSKLLILAFSAKSNPIWELHSVRLGPNPAGKSVRFHSHFPLGSHYVLLVSAHQSSERLFSWVCLCYSGILAPPPPPQRRRLQFIDYNTNISDYTTFRGKNLPLTSFLLQSNAFNSYNPSCRFFLG